MLLDRLKMLLQDPDEFVRAVRDPKERAGRNMQFTAETLRNRGKRGVRLCVSFCSASSSAPLWLRGEIEASCY